MASRFWLAAIIFHAALSPCVALIGWRWVREGRALKSTRHWSSALLRDAGYFGVALCLFAIAVGLASPGLPTPLFAVARFLCQGLFGEGVVLVAWVTALHFRWGLRARGGVFALLTGLLLGVYVEVYHHGPHALQVRRYTLDLSRGRPDAGTLRILHLSDFQTPRIGPYEERVIREAKKQAPDLIVYTGDYIQERLAPTRETASADFTALLRRADLRAPLGSFALEGDVENAHWQRLFAGLGVTCLVNGCAKIALPGGRTLALIGLDTEMSRGNDARALFEIVDAAPPADLRIVLGHSPDFVRTLAGKRKVDLALAGHTHGGQIVLPFIGPLMTLSVLPRKYAGGLHNYHGIPLHVSRGIGMERGVAPQIRFLCPPEICMLEVRY